MRFLILVLVPLFLLAEDLNIILPSQEISKEEIPFEEKAIAKGKKFINKFGISQEEYEKEMNELFIDLKNPTYQSGILYTREGGTISSEDMRIQALEIQYIHQNQKKQPVHRIEAEKDLMIQHKGRIFTGDELEYDFLQKKGVIYNAKTFCSPWYISGDHIDILPNGNYKIYDAVLTTSENKTSGWDIHADSIEIVNKYLLKAKNIQFRVFKIPTIRIPTFKMNLKDFYSTPLIDYYVDYDKSSGPKLGARLRAYSWQDFALYTRLEYRLKMGVGGALETEYHPKDSKTIFNTQNYLASDMIPNDLSKKRRYRVQGVWHLESENKKTSLHATWDKYSDLLMPNDFKTDDFELGTAKKSELILRKEKPEFISILHTRVRANPFETVKQDLPTLYFSPHTLLHPKMKLLFECPLKATYIDLQYSERLIQSIHDLYGFRIEASPMIYRPIQYKALKLLPLFETKGIFYSHTPEDKPIFLGILHGNLYAQTTLFRNYHHTQHRITPYLGYEIWSHPTKCLDCHYIYSIEDGIDYIQFIRTGIKNEWLIPKNHEFSFVWDLYTRIFGPHAEKRSVLPRIYCDLDFNLASWNLSWTNAWDVPNKTYDYSNLRTQITFNDDIALGLELRNRSKYDFRKADRDNFLLEFTRSEQELLHSPLADRRSTILSHLFVRLTPFWTMHFESHHGFNRHHEKPYNEFKVDFYTTLSTSWKIKLSWQHTQEDDRFSFDYFILNY
jgi:hypothetical protein